MGQWICRRAWQRARSGWWAVSKSVGQSGALEMDIEGAGVEGNCLRSVSWNMGGRVKKDAEQAEAVGDRQPDFVALQEVRLSALKQFGELLPSLSLPHVAGSLYLADDEDRTYGELIGSRWAVERIPGTDARTPYPERVLSVSIDSRWGKIEIHAARVVPGRSCGWQRIGMFE